jgi:hypothetical protein
MSVEFSNAYQEILLDNAIAVIKQNFVFQTQIKLAENSSKIIEELKKQIEDLNLAYNDSKSKLSQLDVYKMKAESNNSAHEEKSRIQSALNDEMRKNTLLQKEIDDKKMEIDALKKTHQSEISQLQSNISSLNEYVAKLEELVPVNKLKKLKNTSDEVELEVVEQKNDTPKIVNNIKKVLDGNTF